MLLRRERQLGPTLTWCRSLSIEDPGDQYQDHDEIETAHGGPPYIQESRIALRLLEGRTGAF